MMGITSLAALPLMARPVWVGVQVQVPVPPPPVETLSVPAPAVTVQVGVPDSYFWDGYEYVGLVGDQYYYLGPNHVWITCDPVRLARWNNWQRAHADWRTHATVNMQYRRDAEGNDHPWHANHGQYKSKADTGHDKDHGH